MRINNINLYVDAVHNKRMQTKREKQYVVTKIITFAAVWTAIFMLGVIQCI